MKTANVMIKKVRVLDDRAKEIAKQKGLKEDDLVIVRIHIKQGSLPVYELEKVEGSPITYLQQKIKTAKRCKIENEYGERCRLKEEHKGKHHYWSSIGNYHVWWIKGELKQR